MSKRTTTHETIVAEREYRVAVERAFAAFADPEQRMRWDAPGDGWEVSDFVQDFRVGGREQSRFGPKGDPRYFSDGLYLDIVANRRIVSAGTMYDRDTPMTCTLATIELYPSARGTRLILTDQSVYFGPEKPMRRRGGWGTIMDKLERHFATVLGG
jgi:uncharacterized protein YndB with AHSA1/START domain